MALVIHSPFFGFWVLIEGALKRPLKPDWQWQWCPLQAASHLKPDDLEEMLEYIGINKERLAQRTYRRKIQEIVSEAEELRDVFGIDIRLEWSRKLIT